MGASDDFRSRREADDRAYQAAWDDLSDDQRAEMKAAGIDGPELPEFSTKDPEFREDVELHQEVTESTQHDDIIWILLNMEKHPNSKLAIRVLLKAMKVSPFVEQSDDALGAPFGKRKATVSQLRTRMSEDLEIILNAGKKPESRDVYALSNTSQTKLKY